MYFFHFKFLLLAMYENRGRTVYLSLQMTFTKSVCCLIASQIEKLYQWLVAYFMIFYKQFFFVHFRIYYGKLSNRLFFI